MPYDRLAVVVLGVVPFFVGISINHLGGLGILKRPTVTAIIE